ncbi:hypothetical protein ACROYT_G015785 [Oculina patagonica]
MSSVVEKPKLKIPAAVVIALPYQYLWCSAEGTPPVNVAIMRNNDVLTNSIGYARVTVDSEGAGTYRCVASNEAGMDSKDVQVTLTKEFNALQTEGAPKAPSKFKEVSVQNDLSYPRQTRRLC